MCKGVAAFLAVFCLMACGPALARSSELVGVAADLAAKGDALIAAYDVHSGDAVGDGFSDLYFGLFEGSGMEAEVGAVNAGLKADLEAQFSTIIGMAYRGAPPSELTAQWGKLRADLIRTAHDLSRRTGLGAAGIILQAFIVMVREGGEAVVILGALVAFLRRCGAQGGERVVRQGALAAVVASTLTAWGLSEVVTSIGPVREAIEGASLILAAAMLAYACHWLWFQQETDGWSAYLRGKAQKALTHGRLFPLAAAAFLAVYREGAETVLFYQVLLTGAPGGELFVALGALGGLLCLGVVYALYRLLPRQLPAGAFLAATAVPLFALSVVFAGQGIFALQGAGLVSVSLLPWMPRIGWLGLFPTVEGVAAQAAVLLFLLVLPLALLLRRRPRAQEDTVV